MASVTAENSTNHGDAVQSVVDLPREVLQACVRLLLPTHGFAAPAATCWRDALAAAASSAVLHEALGDALQEEFGGLDALVPASRSLRTAWMSLVKSLSTTDTAQWRQARTLRAVRAIKPHRAPAHSAPRLSGASLCALREGHLVLFGGRDSASGETLGDTYLIDVSWSAPTTPSAPVRGVAQWDVLRSTEGQRQPSARCYHSAALWGGAEPNVLLFGGAGEGSALFDDAWVLEPGERSPPLVRSRPTGRGPVNAARTTYRAACSW